MTKISVRRKNVAFRGLAERALRKVLVTDATFQDFSYETEAAARGGAVFERAQMTTPAEVELAAGDADVLVVQFARVSDKAIANLKPGAGIVRYGIGLDNIDLDAARRRNVPVAYVPDYATGEVADHSVALALTCLRKIATLSDSLINGSWDPVGLCRPLKSFQSSVAGILGFGRIGQEVHARLSAFGFKTIVFDPLADTAMVASLGAQPVSLDELFAEADLLTLHCPLTPETFHIVNAARLKQMKANAVVINTARGGLIDAVALAEALEQGCIAGAGLDVFEIEPLPMESPLRTAKNIVLTPHAAWYSDESTRRVQSLAADEIERHLLGQPFRRPAYA